MAEELDKKLLQALLPFSDVKDMGDLIKNLREKTVTPADVLILAFTLLVIDHPEWQTSAKREKLDRLCDYCLLQLSADQLATLLTQALNKSKIGGIKNAFIQAAQKHLAKQASTPEPKGAPRPRKAG